MQETIEITQAVLGLKPFVLIEFTSFDEETEELGLSVQYGGGIIGSEVPEVLDMVRESVEAQL